MAPPIPVLGSPDYEVDIGAHVFPIRKYRLVRDRLVESGVLESGGVERAAPADEEALKRVHDARYLEQIRRDDFTAPERRRLEIPVSPELADAFRAMCGGTLEAARRVAPGPESVPVAVHLGGGFHHAFADHGEGFCLLNDVAVAAAGILAEGRARRVAVVDLDVHHGNGTAAIFADDDRVFTFSMHQLHNYPLVKPPSDLDVGLPDGIGDDDYLARLRRHLPRVLERDPEVVIYLAGADPFVEDQLGGLALTRDGLRARDRQVLEACRAAGCGVVVTLAGGYARDTADTVAIHAASVEEARTVGSG
jgi:acetoin utilization deacetylase AcuC-like enzyme